MEFGMDQDDWLDDSLLSVGLCRITTVHKTKRHFQKQITPVLFLWREWANLCTARAHHARLGLHTYCEVWRVTGVISLVTAKESTKCTYNWSLFWQCFGLFSKRSLQMYWKCPTMSDKWQVSKVISYWRLLKCPHTGTRIIRTVHIN
jgi:hypothetical protein